MTKRNAIRLLALAGAVLLLGVSCYWTPEDDGNVEGSLSLDMSGISTQAEVTGETARVYLLAEKGKSQGLYPLDDGEDYVDVDVDDTVTIDGIAPGFSYRVLISFGNDNGSWFEVTEYAESESIEVESGSQAEVTVSVETSPFTFPAPVTGVNGKALNGVVFSTDVYAADADQLYDIAANLQTAGSTDITPTINSVSRGDNDPVLVNTQSGIYDESNNLLSTQYTGPVTLSAEFGDDLIFQAPGTIGAVGDIGTGNASDWAVVDVGDTVAGNPVRDYAINTGASSLALVSALGSFTASANSFDSLDDSATWDDIADQVTFIDSDIPARILAVGYGGSTLYVGTDDGVYLSDGTRPPGFTSQNTIISEIASDGTNVAFLGPYYLFIYDGANVERYPFVAGFPGNPTDMTWDDNDPGTLYITGDEGIVSIEEP